jgi:hypothetical protein
MAKADTFAMEKGGYIFRHDRKCAICGAQPEYRAFYYPTYFNGDAEFLGDYCKEHKGTNLLKVCKGEIPIRYPVEGAPKAKVIPPPQKVD